MLKLKTLETMLLVAMLGLLALAMFGKLVFHRTRSNNSDLNVVSVAT